MVSKIRALELCEKYFDTIGDEGVYSCFDGRVVVVDYWQKSAHIYGSFEDLYNFWVEGEILDDFSSIGFEGVEEYLGDELYDWFVHEHANELKVQVA